MPELASPLWAIAGLAAVPLVWWLHKFHRPAATIAVPALFLWKTRAADAPAGPRISKTDPAWLLRAATALCLLLAAAEPAWRGAAGPSVTVWFDDSPSMAAREDGTPRWRLAVAELTAALREADPYRVAVHSLSRPGATLALDADDEGSWTARLSGWLLFDGTERVLPFAVQMAAGAENWLVSDGADPGLAAWLQGVPLDRVIQVGAATENLALGHLSLRRSLGDPGMLVGLVEVRNHGTRPASRSVTLMAGDRRLYRAEISLAPGQVFREGFTVVADDAAPITATLEPGDALALDDAMTLDAGGVAKVPVAVLGACGRPLLAALAAHPAIVPGAGRDPGAPLTISCGPGQPGGGASRLWFRRGEQASPVASDPLWASGVGPLGQIVLRPDWLRAYRASTETGAHRPVLSAGDVPLVLAGPGPGRLVEVRIDVADPNLTARPEFPALIAGLIDLALGRPLLDQVAAVTRPAAASRIAPRDLPGVVPNRAPSTSAPAVDLTVYLIAAALALLLADIFRTRRQLRERP